jgi:hypothetical protein
MAFETTSTTSLIVLFGILAAGAAIFIAFTVFPASNLIRETVTEEGVILSSSNDECVVETSDQIPKTIKNCDLEEGSKVTVKFQSGMYEATIVSQP